MKKIIYNILQWLFGDPMPVNSKEVKKIISNRNDALIITEAIEKSIEEGKEEFTITLSDNKKYKLKKLHTTTVS